VSCRPKYGVQYMYETQMDPHQLRQHTVFVQCQVGHPGTSPMLLAANLPLSQVPGLPITALNIGDKERVRVWQCELLERWEGD